MVAAQHRHLWTWSATAAAGTALLVAGCGTPVPAAAPSPGSGGPCTSGFVADPVSGFEGEPTAADALARWLETPRGDQAAGPGVIPAGVPSDGWVAEQDPGSGPAQQEWQTRSFTSGAWRATAIQSSNGTWMVNQLGCTSG